PGVMDQMGFGYERLCELKRDIILVSVSGFGQYGPYRDRPAFDPLGQAMSGLMDLTGKPVGQPLGAATSLVDRYTSLHATIGMLAALRHRDRTGEGQVVDCCLLDSGFTMVEIPLSYYLATGKEGGEGGRPPYKCKDGYVVISASGRAMATRLIQIATGDESANVAGWTSRAGLDDPRKVAVSKWCEENTVDHVVEDAGPRRPRAHSRRAHGRGAVIAARLRSDDLAGAAGGEGDRVAARQAPHPVPLSACGEREPGGRSRPRVIGGGGSAGPRHSPGRKSQLLRGMTFRRYET